MRDRHPRPFTRAVLATLAILAGASGARAELRELKILSREPFAEGKAFGETGPYERIVAVGRFAISPDHPRNRGIVDLDKAPRNADGKVEFEADVFILAPKDPAKGNGAIFYDVNNRGNKLALRFFNYGPSTNDPTAAKDAGDGFLFRRGYTVVWCGWIGELLAGEHRLLLRAPVATNKGEPIRGIVRYEMVSDKPTSTMPLSRREGHGSYSPTVEGEAKGTLTKRLRETDKREPVSRDQWSLERQPLAAVKQGVPGTLAQIRMRLKGGFEPGYIYELICEAENPIVQGVGFAATRDLISFLKYHATKPNPIAAVNGKPALNRAYGFGVSQSGRFLREFLYQAFNADEQDRKVFDGLIPHVAGGGLGFFNHRFAQPTRHNGQHEEHLYPADRFPFTYGDSVDPFSKRTDGILRRLAEDGGRFMPKVMHTQSAAEYWHRSGSLVHTDPLGKTDAEIPANVRLYAFGGTQHGPAADPPPRGICDNLTNPGDYRPFLRALLDAMDEWVRKGTPPPPSVYPRIDKKTLVDWQQASTGFPKISGVRYPTVIQRPPAADYGPDFYTKGLVTVEPPRVLGQYTVLVPKSGRDGNDLGTLLPPEVLTPLATYTGWNLRRKDVGADGELASLLGSYLPFQRAARDRKPTGDPRESLEERYGTFENYRRMFGVSIADLASRRYVLREDWDRIFADRGKVLKLFPATK
ncbi:MAG TPA: alpha/beta hydrolase domain-containing protein [Gemmataceae bacterium]|nr:alpha/beta hydrolase domain-containing protein [Gemmataceae bacterium]